MNYLSPYMYGDPNFRVTTTSKSKPMAPVLIASLVSAGAGLLNSILGAIGSNDQQKLAIDNQWDMFNAQKDYQTSVNDKAMAFQREVNQMNMDWNTESNVRQRIEDAGYNPYLYQNGAMSANVNGSVPLSSSVSAPSPVALPNAASAFSSSVIDSIKGVADIFKTGQEARSIASSADTSEYNLGRQKTKDNYVIGGLKLPIIEASQNYYNYSRAFDLSVQEDVNTRVARLRDTLLNAPATDENSQPITDESGNVLNWYQASARAEFRKSLLEVNKVTAEINKVKTETDINKVQKKLMNYQYKYLQPAQIAQINATIDQLKADIKLKTNSADFVKEQMRSEIVRRFGYNLSNKLLQKDLDSYDTNKVYNRIGILANPFLKGIGMAIRR